MRGSSAGAVWEISAEYPEARLTLGADPSAGWPIEAPGVHPIHCELFWDGTALWVADTHGAGGVFLDGQRVSEWVQIQGPCELRFGTAALDVETSPPAHEQMVSRPDHARPVTMTDMHAPPESARRSRPIFGGAAGDDSIPELDAAATRVVASPIAPPAAAPQAAGEMPDLRPRLGGEVVAGSAEATRMVAMPLARPSAPSAAVPSAAPPSPPAQNAGLAPAPVVAPPPTPLAPSFGQPAQPPPAFPAAAPGGPPPAPEGAFVAPPAAPPPAKKASPLDPVLEALKPIVEKLKPQSSADVVSASGGKKGQTLPTRTWIMLAVTVAAAAGLLLWEGEAPQAAPPAPQAAAVAVPAEPPAPAEPPEPAPTPPVAPVEPSSVVAAESEGASEEAEEGEEGDEEPAQSLQRQAADLYIGGRYPEALAIYRQLAEAHPERAAYASMVRILERRTRCQDGVGPGGEPCSEP